MRSDCPFLLSVTTGKDSIQQCPAQVTKGQGMESVHFGNRAGFGMGSQEPGANPAKADPAALLLRSTSRGGSAWQSSGFSGHKEKRPQD